MTKLSFRTVASALVAAAMLVPAAAEAYPGGGFGYDPRGYDRQGYEQPVYDQRDYDQRGYDPRGYADDRGGGYERDYTYARGYDAPPPPPPVRYRRGYRDADYGPPGYYREDRRYRCDSGTGGTIIGAIAGGLLGNGIAGRGDRGAGTIIGAGVGALAGRAVDRNC